MIRQGHHLWILFVCVADAFLRALPHSAPTPTETPPAVRVAPVPSVCPLKGVDSSSFTASLRELERVRMSITVKMQNVNVVLFYLTDGGSWLAPNYASLIETDRYLPWSFECIAFLFQCGWYWGPMNWEDAELKLKGKPDGSFLVRDSSDPRYILSLSFRSQGVTHHTRMEHYRGNQNIIPFTQYIEIHYGYKEWHGVLWRSVFRYLQLMVPSKVWGPLPFCSGVYRACHYAFKERKIPLLSALTCTW